MFFCHQQSHFRKPQVITPRLSCLPSETTEGAHNFGTKGFSHWRLVSPRSSFLSFSSGLDSTLFFEGKTFFIDFFLLQWVAQQQREDRMPRGFKGELENSRKYKVSAFPKEVILSEQNPWNIFIIKLILIHFRLEVLRARSKKLFKLGVGNGGWGDLRDHQLCLNISNHR